MRKLTDDERQCVREHNAFTAGACLTLAAILVLAFVFAIGYAVGVGYRFA